MINSNGDYCSLTMRVLQLPAPLEWCRDLAVTDDHVCESSIPLQGQQNYSNIRVCGYGLLGKLSLIIRQLERTLLKPANISVSAMAGFLVGSREGHHSGVIVWDTWIDGHVYASYLILVFIVQD